MRGDDLLRSRRSYRLPKSRISGRASRVQHVFHPGAVAGMASDDHRTRIVFITRDLPQDAIERNLTALRTPTSRWSLSTGFIRAEFITLDPLMPSSAA